MNKFDEGKHPRDKEGKFTKKSGANSGALNPLDEKDYLKAKAHAELMYLEICKRKSDCKKVAKTVGITEEQANEIKQYVFNNKEFVPDYDQAESWRRITEGKPLDVDFLFIKHELYEISLRKKGMSYQEAHDLTNKEYDYGKAIKEYHNGKADKKTTK